MRNIRKIPAWLALVAAVSLVAAACGGDPETEPEPTAAPTGGEFSIQICEPESLIPQVNAETCGSQVLKGLFTPLIQFDTEDQLVYAGAE